MERKSTLFCAGHGHQLGVSVARGPASERVQASAVGFESRDLVKRGARLALHFWRAFSSAFAAAASLFFFAMRLPMVAATRKNKLMDKWSFAASAGSQFEPDVRTQTCWAQPAPTDQARQFRPNLIAVSQQIRFILHSWMLVCACSCGQALSGPGKRKRMWETRPMAERAVITSWCLCRQAGSSTGRKMQMHH